LENLRPWCEIPNFWHEIPTLGAGRQCHSYVLLRRSTVARRRIEAGQLEAVDRGRSDCSGGAAHLHSSARTGSTRRLWRVPRRAHWSNGRGALNSAAVLLLRSALQPHGKQHPDRALPAQLPRPGPHSDDDARLREVTPGTRGAPVNFSTTSPTSRTSWQNPPSLGAVDSVAVGGLWLTTAPRALRSPGRSQPGRTDVANSY
jgi:hypothetical protein